MRREYKLRAGGSVSAGWVGVRIPSELFYGWPIRIVALQHLGADTGDCASLGQGVEYEVAKTTVELVDRNHAAISRRAWRRQHPRSRPPRERGRRS